MKKVEKVEVKYIKLDTVIVIAIACLLIGFIGGNIYNIYKSGPESSGQQAGPNQAGPSLENAGAILNLERTVEADPGNAGAWLQLGNLYFDANEYQKSINAYQKYLSLNPGNSNAWTDLGIMYRRNRQPEDAVTSFEKAIEIDPRHEQARFNKGIVLMYDLNQREEALRIWRELEKMNPSYKIPNGQSITDFLNNL